MPELPEVETVVRSLFPCLTGQKIADYQLIDAKVWRGGNLFFLDNLKGKLITKIWRRGKLALIQVATGEILIFHLKMTGRLIWVPKASPRPKHTRFILNFQEVEEELRFVDPRRFGFIACRRSEEVEKETAPELAGLGPDALTVSWEEFKKIFGQRTARLKSLLLDQRLIAGIGNIYADEILFRARLNPLLPANYLSEKEWQLLWQKIKETLQEAIKYRGTSIRDYRDGANQKGNFQDRLLVYGREQQACPVCGQKIARSRIGGRSTYFCPKCQKLLNQKKSRKK